ncbi:MAG: formylglycine-generating enzyme family protein [Armatimonadetes bacterium]|nr:formylglycine-generating enzyme family protein [Armatimonadota bacterium]
MSFLRNPSWQAIVFVAALNVILVALPSLARGPRDLPPGMVRVAEDFWLDAREVSNADFHAFADATGYKAEGNWRLYAIPGRETRPVVGVTWNDAAAYATWKGKRLPTAAESTEAARGADGGPYPWGKQWRDGAANVNTRGDAAVGSFPQDKSPCGAFDLAGNVMEWTSSSVAEDPKQRVVRGGCWMYFKDIAGADHVIAFPSKQASYCVGFRCAWPPARQR